MTHFAGKRLYLTEFDESLDEMMTDVIQIATGPIGKGQSLEVWINSDGGDSYRAFALVELMEHAKARGVTVKTFVLHCGHSAASLVSVAGTLGHRYVAKRATMLVHYGSVDTTFTHPTDMERNFEDTSA
jgi:ATP-dependent protease ClpP protease subunit